MYVVAFSAGVWKRLKDGPTTYLHSGIDVIKSTYCFGSVDRKAICTQVVFNPISGVNVRESNRTQSDKTLDFQ